MKTKDFYFQIPNSGIRDFVTAYSFVDAKARFWRQYPQHLESVHWEDPTDPIPEEPCGRLFF